MQQGKSGLSPAAAPTSPYSPPVTAVSPRISQGCNLKLSTHKKGRILHFLLESSRKPQAKSHPPAELTAEATKRNLSERVVALN
jgi:hypothetical protein